MPRRILHILGSAQPQGIGIAQIVRALAEGLDPARYEWHALFLKEEGSLMDDLSESGVAVQVIDWKRGARDPRGAMNLLRAFRQTEFDIVHQHFGGRSVRWLAKGFGRRRLVLHLHGERLDARPEVPLHLTIRRADAVIATSAAAASIVSGAPVHVVHPGIDVGRWSPGSERADTIVIGTARRLIPVKGIIHLVRAFAVLWSEFPDMRLEIAGDGPERGAIEAEAARLGVADRVTMLGWRADLPAVVSSWSVFVLPSIEEGFGIAAAEAMAAGLPVVATNVGGLPELVVDGETGYLVPPADPEALAAGIRRLLLSPEQRSAFGAAGRARVERSFSVENMVGKIEAIYDALLRNQREEARS
jgi:glycosyltransferase involved in cell wall biosynthesis